MQANKQAITLAQKALRADGIVGMPEWLDKICELAAGDKELERQAIEVAMITFAKLVTDSFYKDGLLPSKGKNYLGEY